MISTNVKDGLKILLLLIGILVTSLSIFFISIHLYESSKVDQYKEAIEFETSGNYWNAYLIYIELGEFQDSKKRAERIYPKAAMQYSLELFAQGKSIEAIPYLDDAIRGNVPGAKSVMKYIITDYLKKLE